VPTNVCYAGLLEQKSIFRLTLISAERQFAGDKLITNALFARPDHDRIKEVGPNRACAEWLLRCGAALKWKGSDHFQTDYHALPPSNFRSFLIEEVEAVEAGIMDVGFEHFGEIFCHVFMYSKLIQLFSGCDINGFYYERLFRLILGPFHKLVELLSGCVLSVCLAP